MCDDVRDHVDIEESLKVGQHRQRNNSLVGQAQLLTSRHNIVKELVEAHALLSGRIVEVERCGVVLIPETNGNSVQSTLKI